MSPVRAVPSEPAVVTAERRVALVLGNAAYAHTPRLVNPANDARAMAERLQALGFTLVGGEPALDLNRGGMEAAIRRFGQMLRAEGGVGLIYYSGHGFQVGGVNYLLPVSANIGSAADVRYETIDLDLILGEIQQAANTLTIVILDACRNNPFAGRGVRAVADGLAQVNTPTGTVIAYSTAPGRVAEDGTGAHSPYTAALLSALAEPGLRLEDVFIRTRVEVERQTAGAQIPWKLVSLRGRSTSALPVHRQPRRRRRPRAVRRPIARRCSGRRSRTAPIGPPIRDT